MSFIDRVRAALVRDVPEPDPKALMRQQFVAGLPMIVQQPAQELSIVGQVLGLLERFAPKRKADTAPVNEASVAIPTWMAGQPRSPEVNQRLLTDEGYRRNVVIYACVNVLAESAAEPNVLVRSKSKKEQVDETHDLVRLLDNPHPMFSRYSLFETSIIHQQATGNCYIHKGRARSGNIVRLTPLRPDRISAVPSSDGRGVQAYEYSVDGIKKSPLPADDVISIPLFDPLSDYYGMSPVQVAAKFADLDSEAALFLRDFFMNGAVPMGLLKIKGRATKTERDAARMEWSETYGRGSGGRDQSNWWNVGVINGDVDYTPVGIDPSKLKLDGIWGITEARICSAFRVPAILAQMKVGLDSSTYSNYAEARKTLWSDTLPPIYRRFSERLSQQLAAEFDDDLEIVFDIDAVPALAETDDVKAERAVKLYSAGIISRNEARERLGEEELEADALVMPNGARPFKKGDPTDALLEPPLGPLAALKPGDPKDDPDDDDPPRRIKLPAEPDEDDDRVRQQAGALVRKADDAAAVEPLFARAAELSREVDGIVADILARVDVQALDRAIEDRNVIRAEAAIPWRDWSARYASALEAYLNDVTDDAVSAAVDVRVPTVNAKAKPMKPKASRKAWVQERVRTEVARTARDGTMAIREAILRAYQDALKAAEARAAVLDAIGLTRQQAQWVWNYRARLFKGKSQPSTITKKVARYTRKLRKARAQLIGRHETRRAILAGQLEAWDRLRENKVIGWDWEKQWIVTSPDERVCPECSSLDGEQVPIDELFDDAYMGPPEPHPDCACRLALVPPA